MPRAPRAPMRPRRAPRRGAALLLAMVILTLVAAVAAGMVWQQNRAVQVEAAERARAQAGWILQGALDWARLILREDQKANNQRRRSGQDSYDGLDEPWATPLAEARLSSFLAADRDNTFETGVEAFLSGFIVDAQSRLNLRGLVGGDGKIVAASLEGLRRVVDLAGAPTDTADRIAQGLQAAWASAGDDAERTAPIAPSTLDELVWIGVEPETLAKLEPFVTVLPAPTPVNVNTATREALVGAIDGLDLGTAERLVQQRQRQPFESLVSVQAQLPPELKLDAARVGVATRWFEVSGRLRYEDRVLEERSLVERRENDVVVRRRERLGLSAGL